MTKICVCGRSKEYPVCDGSHKIKTDKIVDETVESNSDTIYE